MLGIIQEQHAERYRLFAQWKEMDFPVLHDPLNKLGIKVVPVFVAIDEHGIVRSTRPNVRSIESEFINRTFEAPQQPAPRIDKAQFAPGYFEKQLESSPDAQAYIDLGDSHLICDENPNLSKVVIYYQQAQKADPTRSDSHFRLGVAFRMRFDSKSRQTGDFSNASQHWTEALLMDPNHYIWRRRIQQYGPQMDKPYPFYNWISQARKEIAARGESPIQLSVEPKGAELAMPSRQFSPSANATNPDPESKITQDGQGLIVSSVATVPAIATAGSTVRVHVTMQPAFNAKWNNEAGKSIVWINSADGIKLSQQLLEMEQPKEVESNEDRSIEFEIAIPDNATEKIEVTGFALYYVCEETDGQCLYLRQNIEFEIPVVKKTRKRR